MDAILFALWFFLPAGLANSAPVFGNKVPGFNQWNTPMDFGKHYRGQRIFGANKRWRGLVSGVVVATVTLAFQVWAFNNFGWVQGIAANVDYANLPVLILGPLFAIGALGGDAIESFFKRQRHIPSGKSWFPFDQLDYILGGLLASAAVVPLHFREYLMVVLVWFCIHLLATYVGYIIGLREAKI